MYDMRQYKKRYFDITLPSGQVINVEPPKVKILKKIMALGSTQETGDMTEEEFDNLIEALSLAISKNKQNYKVSIESIEEDWDINEVQDLLENYFNWINETQKN